MGLSFLILCFMLNFYTVAALGKCAHWRKSVRIDIVSHFLVDFLQQMTKVMGVIPIWFYDHGSNMKERFLWDWWDARGKVIRMHCNAFVALALYIYHNYFIFSILELIQVLQFRRKKSEKDSSNRKIPKIKSKWLIVFWIFKGTMLWTCDWAEIQWKMSGHFILSVA